MGYYFARDLLLRMPGGNAADYTMDKSVILANPIFRTALMLASPVFYAKLEQFGFRAELLSRKQQHTLQKYYNRFCFRPTPFGLFASVTLTEWGENAVSHAAEFNYHPIIRADQRYLAALTSGLLRNGDKGGAFFDPNPSIYRVLNEFRFIRSSLDEGFSSRNFSLQTIAYSKLLGDLLSFSTGGRTGNEIVFYIVEGAGCTSTEANAYLEFLVDAQLLLNRVRPNITGGDFLDRIPDIQMNAVSKIFSRNHAISEHYFRDLKSDLREYLPEGVRDQIQDELNVILHRYSTGDGLSKEFQLLLDAGINALSILVPEGKNNAMQAFVRQFNIRFEGQCIPLLTALDPEAGIGYQVPDSDRINPLLETLHIPGNTPVDHSVNWTAAHALLLERWHSKEFQQNGIIRLQPEDVDGLRTPGDAPPAMLGMSVLFRQIGEQVHIESAGGNNAAALMGRFTIGDPGITLSARRMAKAQEKQNPGLLFVEILHLSDPHTDNINRREQIWAYELPVTALSLLPAERQLELSNLYVATYENQVYLYSKKHRKVVLPRLTSAYNHGLNKLPLFRFLADISYQYGRNNLFLDLRQFFPGLGFYPRVEYGQTILFAATWVLRDVQLAQLGTDSPEINLHHLKQLREELRIPAAITIADGDQHLHFDLRNAPETIFFLDCIRNKNEVVLKEIINDEPVRQYNAYLLPDVALKLPPMGIFKSALGNLPALHRKFVPGSEWLYLKIYAPKMSSSRLLLKLRPILRRKFSHGPVRRWFFIRYEDHAPHLRLRMQVDPMDTGEVLSAFKTKLEDRIRQHVVREYQVDVYSRELERYNYAGMEKTETFFWVSSELVIQAITTVTNDEELYLFALKSTLTILRTFIRQEDVLIDFCYQSYAQFSAEFKVTKLHVELDQKYRKLQKDINNALDDKNEKFLNPKRKTVKNFVRSLIRLAESPDNNTTDRYQYLSSIVHMHVNRVFAEEARKQEMITYYLLYKFLLAKKGKARQHHKP